MVPITEQAQLLFHLFPPVEHRGGRPRVGAWKYERHVRNVRREVCRERPIVIVRQDVALLGGPPAQPSEVQEEARDEDSRQAGGASL